MGTAAQRGCMSGRAQGLYACFPPGFCARIIWLCCRQGIGLSRTGKVMRGGLTYCERLSRAYLHAACGMGCETGNAQTPWRGT